MAKFNIEVELDWMYEGENVDEALKEKVISGIQNKLTANIEREAQEQLTEQLTTKVDEVVDQFMENIISDKLEDIKIPHKEGYYSSKVEFIPITEFIGNRFEEALTKKTLTKNGRRPDWSDDAVYSVMEYLTEGYIADELNGKVVSMIREARKQAEETLIKNLEENLQQQLNADMIQKLDIPSLLESMKNTISIEGDNK